MNPQVRSSLDRSSRTGISTPCLHGFLVIMSEGSPINRPRLIISDIGVSTERINLVFEESGCLGTLDDLRSGRLCHANPQWLEANYFHASEENNWLELLTQLLAVGAFRGLGLEARCRGVCGGASA